MLLLSAEYGYVTLPILLQGSSNSNNGFREQHSHATSCFEETTQISPSSTPPTTSQCQLTTSSTIHSTSHTSMDASIYATGLMRNSIKTVDLSSCSNLEKRPVKIVWGFCRRDCCTSWHNIHMVLPSCSSIDTMELVSRSRI